jgi:hypothetical protein
LVGIFSVLRDVFGDFAKWRALRLLSRSRWWSAVEEWLTTGATWSEIREEQREDH